MCKKKTECSFGGYRELWERRGYLGGSEREHVMKTQAFKALRDSKKGMWVVVKATLVASKFSLGQALPFSSFLGPVVAAIWFWWNITNPSIVSQLIWSVDSWRSELDCMMSLKAITGWAWIRRAEQTRHWWQMLHSLCSPLGTKIEVFN